LTPCPLMASIGNNRPNAISENGPSCDPDYERNGELHHVSFRLWFREPGGGWPPPSPVGDGAQLSRHVMKSMNQTPPSANSRMTSASPISPTILMAAPTPRQNECRGTAVPPVHCYLDNGHRIRARCWWQVPARRRQSAGRGAWQRAPLLDLASIELR
jgi:hypothetical protein